MNDELRERIADALRDALLSNEASASGYGDEFARDEGGTIVKLDGDFDLAKLADTIIRDLGLKAKYAGRLGVTDRWHAVGDAWIEG